MKSNIDRSTIVLIVPPPCVSIQHAKSVLEPGEYAKVVTRAKLEGLAGTTLNDVFYKKEELMGIGIKHNRIKCKNCGDIIESLFKYHSVRCGCGKCMIDGGTEELLRNCNEVFEELTEYYSML